MKRILLAVACIALAAPAFAQKPLTPLPSSPLRRAILDSLRIAVEKDLKPKVIFVVKALRVLDGWAFVSAEAQRPGGKAIDFTTLPKYRDDVAEGTFDGPSTFALLRKKAGGWKVVTFDIGPTDVSWSDWSERFGAPIAILGLPPSALPPPALPPPALPPPALPPPALPPPALPPPALPPPAL